VIYGINFNGVAIPEGVQRLFPQEMKIYRCAACGTERTQRTATLGKPLPCRKCAASTLHNAVRGHRSRLVGVGQSESERDAMWIQATNGSRQLHIEPRQTAGGVWYGFYAF
jgi:DNA-directed RNA polymerase subunit RPC12/RpoP